MGAATSAKPVKMGLLALLLNGPAHGYELRQRFEDAAGGVWPLNIGQVYDSLKRLDRDGFVERAESVEIESGDGRGSERRAFQLTPAGREEATHWLEETVESTAVSRDELAMRVLIAYATGAELTALLQRERESFMRRMQVLVRRKSDAAKRGETAEVLLLDMLELRLRADTEWLALAEQRLTTTPRELR